MCFGCTGRGVAGLRGRACRTASPVCRASNGLQGGLPGVCSLCVDGAYNLFKHLPFFASCGLSLCRQRQSACVLNSDCPLPPRPCRRLLAAARTCWPCPRVTQTSPLRSRSATRRRWCRGRSRMCSARCCTPAATGSGASGVCVTNSCGSRVLSPCDCCVYCLGPAAAEFRGNRPEVLVSCVWCCPCLPGCLPACLLASIHTGCTP